MKRYIIKNGKARISFSDIDKVARTNNFDELAFRNMIIGRLYFYDGWSLEWESE